MDEQQCYRTVARLSTGQFNHKWSASPELLEAALVHVGSCMRKAPLDAHRSSVDGLRVPRTLLYNVAALPKPVGTLSSCSPTLPYSIIVRIRETFDFAGIMSADYELHLTGNNYAITNESETRSAKVFFAQGCVVDSAADGEK